MQQRWLTALPVYNEVKYVEQVLKEVRRYSLDILVVDDGSQDGTSELLATQPNIQLVTHPRNLGYGAALRSAFAYAIRAGFDGVVTIDCDGQHEPQRIPDFVEAGHKTAIVSGSRYMQKFAGDSRPPNERRWINEQVTAELNHRLCLQLSDAFCGFKAYRVDALRQLELTENGYAMPLELWVQAAHRELEIVERAVPLIYLDEERSFGGALEDADTRLQYYHRVLDRSIAALETAAVGSTVSVCGDDAG